MELRADGKLAGWLAFVGIFSAISYAGRFAGGEQPEDLLYRWSTVILGVVQFAIIIGVLLLIARGLPKRPAFALQRPQSWPQALILAGALFLGILVFASILSPFINPGEEQGLVPEQWEPSRAAAFAANAVVVTAIAPVVEELTFRGLGFTLLLRFGRWTAIVAIGIVFALVHGLVEGFPILAVFGGALAYLRSRTGSIYPAILLHAAFNGFALGASLLT